MHSGTHQKAGPRAKCRLCRRRYFDNCLSVRDTRGYCGVCRNANRCPICFGPSRGVRWCDACRGLAGAAHAAKAGAVRPPPPGDAAALVEHYAARAAARLPLFGHLPSPPEPANGLGYKTFPAG